MKYEDARAAAIDAATAGRIRSGGGTLSPEDKAKGIKLLITYGPPREWSGAVAATLSPEDRALITRVWKSLSKEEQNAVYAKFEAAMEGENVKSPDEESDAEEAAEHGVTPENIDAKGREAAARLDKLLAGGPRKSMKQMTEDAVDAAIASAPKK